MTTLPASLPRATELRAFYANPIDFLARAHATLGDIFVLREDGPLFSRRSDCSGVVAIFGPTKTQTVLTDSDVFGLPISAAEHLALPENLINLNRGLHSMLGAQHDEQQRLLLQIFSSRSLETIEKPISEGLEAFVQSWNYNDEISLLEEMRRLALELSTRVLFDQRYDESHQLAELAQKYFHMRRHVTSTFNSQKDDEAKKELIALGSSLDQAMRNYITWCRKSEGSDGLIAKLACLQVGAERSFSEDEAVAHANVTLMSTNEPIAVTLTWTLLILSQLPELRGALRDELEPSLLNCVVNESLRLFTPNALMSRITTRPTSLDGVQLPARCELVICPFLAHRDAKVFPRPKQFLPSRWQTAKPSPFEYFPFGAGRHACIGRSLGLKIIKTTLAFLMQPYELVLAFDQEIDWQIEIVFMPANDPIVKLREPGTIDGEVRTLVGATRALFDL